MLDNILKVISNLQKRKGEGKMETQQLITFQAVQKKPVEVEACQLTQEIWCQLFNSESSTTKIGNYQLAAMHNDDQQYFLIETLEDVDGQFHRAEINDWMIKGVQNEIYACKPDIFSATYDFVNYGTVATPAEFFAENVNVDPTLETRAFIENSESSPVVMGVNPAAKVQESPQDGSASQAGFTPDGEFVAQTEEQTANEYHINGDCVKV